MPDLPVSRVPGSQDERPAVLEDRFDEPLIIVHVIFKIGILNQADIAGRVSESAPDGVPLPARSLFPDDPHPGVGAIFRDRFAGSIARIALDDDDLLAHPEHLLAQDSVQQWTHRLPLVVDRNDDAQCLWPRIERPHPFHRPDRIRGTGEAYVHSRQQAVRQHTTDSLHQAGDSGLRIGPGSIIQVGKRIVAPAVAHGHALKPGPPERGVNRRATEHVPIFRPQLGPRISEETSHPTIDQRTHEQ